MTPEIMRKLLVAGTAVAALSRRNCAPALNPADTAPSGTGSMSQDLKPCPFCGGTDIALGRDEDVCWNQCRRCEASGPTMRKYDGDDEPEWNTRPLQAEGAPAAEGAWDRIAPAKRFGRRLDEGAVPHIAPGSLLRFYSEDPWFDPSGDAPRNGDIVVFTGKVSNDFPKVGPHLEVAALSGRVYPGGGWAYQIFQFVADPALSPPAAEGKEECSKCVGTGTASTGGLDWQAEFGPCPACNGTGDEAPAPAAEPVGFRMLQRDGSVLSIQTEPYHAGFAEMMAKDCGCAVQPLYASPPQQPVEISRTDLELMFVEGLRAQSYGYQINAEGFVTTVEQFAFLNFAPIIDAILAALTKNIAANTTDTKEST